jgi:23S rRNA pseudouridine1911/1915/1917 synthase
MLHSSEIEFVHPTTGKLMHFEAPLPDYFENIINELEKT